MKSIPSGLEAHLASGATTLAFCWEILRRDGVRLGFTDHDSPLTVAGLVHEASSAFEASEIEHGLGLSVPNAEARGALKSGALTEADLTAGRYDGALVTLRIVNWAAPADAMIFAKGVIGEVRRNRTAFAAELRGISALLNQRIGRVYGYGCDAELGDSRCKVDLLSPAFHATGAVLIDLDGGRLFSVSGVSGFAEDWFTAGLLTWTSGARTGLRAEIRRHLKTPSQVTIELWEGNGGPLNPGDAFSLTAGCDKSLATCRAKFANIANFRGFPHMPGNDAVQRSPGAAEPLDGGSLIR